MASFLLTAIAVGLASVPANAQSIPGVTFIPDKLSVNSSFVMIADTGSLPDPLRVSWVFVGDIWSGIEYIGQMPYTGSRYMCYFSDTDVEATCGPSPLRYSSDQIGVDYELEVKITDTDGNQANKTFSIPVGGIPLEPDIDSDGSNVSILVYIGKTADVVSYKVLDSEFGDVTSGFTDLEQLEGTPWFSGELELDPGTYYFAFEAESADDFGGGIQKVTVAAGSSNGGGNGTTNPGAIESEAFDVEVVVGEGSTPTLPQKKLINTENETFTDLTVSLPSGFSSYIRITPENRTIMPYGIMYYTVTLLNIDSAMDIGTTAEIYSGTDIVGTILISLNISYVGSGSGAVDCTGLSDGTKCLGGLCCSGSCVERIECCTSSDCSGGACDPFTNRCGDGGGDIDCTTGSCITSSSSCASGSTQSGTCRRSGFSGICCVSDGGGDECDSLFEGDECNNGLGMCCSGECEEYAQCCTSIQCDEGETCDDFFSCTSVVVPPAPVIDYTLIMIIALVAVGALVAFIVFKKIKKKGSEEEGFEKKKDDDAFSEEEFYYTKSGSSWRGK